MAKLSSINKNERRKKLVKKYAAKYAKLKAIADDESRDEGEPAIKHVARVSKPGRRVYSGSRELPTVRNGLGITIVSTPRGVLSDAEAREHNVGGEVLAEVF